MEARGKPVRSRKTACPQAIRRRDRKGTILPFVAFAMAVIIAFTALAVDVMRSAHAVSVLNYGAQSAALAAYSYATSSDGSFTIASAQNNMTAAVQSAGGSSGTPWHEAPAGPDTASNTYKTPIQFDGSDIVFVNNPEPADNTDFFLQVRARRDGTDALKMIFMPCIFAFNSLTGTPVPPGLDVANPYRTIEVVGQPASRVGAGPPRTSIQGTRAAELVRFASFPLAISNAQFAQAAQPSQTINTYIIDLGSAIQPPPPVQPGHMRGAFINVAPTGGMQYYGSGQGNVAIDELNHTLEYFASSAIASAISPAVVERGSRVFAFDRADPTFQARKASIIAAARQVPIGSYCIIPVVRMDPSFNGSNEVVGFARMRLRSMVDASGTDFSMQFDVAESVPVRNASFANGLSTVPAFTGSTMPPPVAPFMERAYNASDNSMAARMRSIAMAPALSPRPMPRP